MPGLAAIRRINDPRRRAARAAELLDRLEPELLEIRDEACREMLARGVSAAEVGRVIGRTRAAVAKRFATKGTG